MWPRLGVQSCGRTSRPRGISSSSRGQLDVNWGRKGDHTLHKSRVITPLCQLFIFLSLNCSFFPLLDASGSSYCCPSWASLPKHARTQRRRGPLASADFYTCTFLQTRARSRTASVTARACLCVRTVCGALTGQCSVQCRREQRRPRPGQTRYPGNPRVFRSPGPYLMSLSKKKVALSGVFLSHCLPLALLFPSFSHALHPPHPTNPPPLSPGATLRMNGFQVFTQQLWPTLYVSPHFT